MKRVQTFMLALGVLLCSWGKGNGVGVGEWTEVKQFNFSRDSFLPNALYVVSDDDVWLAGAGSRQESVIYRFHSGRWTKETGVPDIGGLGDIAMVGPTKGWAVGPNGVLEYDGVFWTIVPDMEGSDGTGHLISIASETDVWFASPYRYRNGQYESSSIPSGVGEIIMKGSNRGYLSSTATNGFYQYSGVSWTEIYDVPGIRGISSWAVDNSNRIWYVDASFQYILRIVENGSETLLRLDQGDIKVLEVDKDGDVWISYNSLIERIPADPTQQFENSSMPGNIDDLQFNSTFAWALSPGSTSHILKGTILLPTIKIKSASAINFADVHFSQLPQVNTQTRRNLALSNIGKGTLQVSSIASDNPVFRIQPTSGTVTPGDSLQITVVYFPTTAGQHTGHLTIQSNDPTSPSLQIELTGATLGSIQPKISASSSLSFTSTPTNATITRDLTIQNTGNARLSISSISSSSEVFRANADSLSIGPGSSRSITISFAPTAEGQTSARLTLLSDDPATPSLQVSLRGIGELPLPPQPTANTGNLSVKPSNPSTVDQVTLSLAGNFPTANAVIRTQTHTIVGSTISVDLTTAWSGDPRNTTVTPWKIDEAVGQLSAGAYTVLVNVNGTRFYSSSLTVLEGPPPEGPVSFDFNLAAGDQKLRTVGSATTGKTYQLQLNVDDAPEINGWSVTIEYDPRQVRYVSDSFQASSFISGLLALVDEKEGSVGVGGTVLGSSGKNSGDGIVGTLVFEVLEGVSDSTDLTITEVTFRRLDGVEDKRAVRSVATIKKAAVAGLLAGDFDGNGKVEFDDFFLFADAFGSANPGFDLSGNGAVDFDDFFLFADNFGKEAQAKLIALAREYLGLPASPHLEQNYPNPFNSSTTLRYQLAEVGQVNLEVYDVSGQKVRSLVSVQQTPGIYSVTWGGTNEQGMEISTGIYFARLQAGEYTQVNKMMLMK